MPLYRPSELIQFLKEMGISAKKGLSQNFLIDGNICRKIVQAADPKPGETVLEIGPGPGVVTEQLLASGAKVIAVEKDHALADALQKWEHPNLTVYCADILEFPIEEKLPAGSKVVSNLPYHITTPIITRLVEEHTLFTKIVIMIQDEVARRFTAKCGSREYGSISVFLQYHCDLSYAFRVSRNCFFPKPNVDSAVVLLDLHTPPEVDEIPFFEMTRAAFGKRRKMLKKALDELYEPETVTKALEELGLNPLARAEDLSLEEYIQLFTSKLQGHSRNQTDRRDG